MSFLPSWTILRWMQDVWLCERLALTSECGVLLSEKGKLLSRFTEVHPIFTYYHIREGEWIFNFPCHFHSFVIEMFSFLNLTLYYLNISNQSAFTVALVLSRVLLPWSLVNTLGSVTWMYGWIVWMTDPHRYYPENFSEIIQFVFEDMYFPVSDLFGHESRKFVSPFLIVASVLTAHARVSLRLSTPVSYYCLTCSSSALSMWDRVRNHYFPRRTIFVCPSVLNTRRGLLSSIVRNDNASLRWVDTLCTLLTVYRRICIELPFLPFFDQFIYTSRVHILGWFLTSLPQCLNVSTLGYSFPIWMLFAWFYRILFLRNHGARVFKFFAPLDILGSR